MTIIQAFETALNNETAKANLRNPFQRNSSGCKIISASEKDIAMSIVWAMMTNNPASPRNKLHQANQKNPLESKYGYQHLNIIVAEQQCNDIALFHNNLGRYWGRPWTKFVPSLNYLGKNVQTIMVTPSKQYTSRSDCEDLALILYWQGSQTT